MEILSSLGLLLLGFFILILGGESLVRAAISISARFHVKPMIIGMTIIAAGTSAPELMTSIIASLKNSPDIALGNVVGSNIFNILAIIGLSCLIQPNRVDRSMARFEVPALIIFTLVLILACANGVVSKLEGSLFLISLAVFIFISIRRSRLYPQQSSPEDDEIVALKHWGLDVVYLIFGFIGLLFGADLALDGGIAIGRLAGLSERIIGITIISVGTGLPELATSAVAAYRGRDDIAISSIIGSNIMNILMVIGSASMIAPIIVNENILKIDSAWMMAATLCLAPALYFTGGRMGRKTGFIFFMGYISYLLFLLLVR